MKMNKLTTMLALTGAAFLPMTVHAASSATAASGDFIMGFQTTSSNTGGSFNLEVDLGSAASFVSLEGTGKTVNLTLGSTTAGYTGAFSLSDLTSTYGSSPAALFFGVEGSYGAPGSNETFISDTGMDTKTLTGNSYAPKMQTVYAGFNITDDAAATAGSTDTIIASGATNSYETIAVGTTAHYSNTYAFTTQVQYTAGGSESLNLFDVAVNAAPVKVGTLTLDNGDLTFTGTAAVPEPSTYAMMAAGLVFLVAFRRRLSLNA
jgi:hypothetical protein